VALTEAGIVFADPVRFILSRIDEAALSPAGRPGMSGEIRVGFTESGCFHPAVTKILLEFRKTYPIRRGRLDGREIMEMRITEIADRTHRLSNYVAEIASPAGLTYNQFLAFVTLVDPRNSSCAGRCQVLWDERRPPIAKRFE
jgi:DNA-binding transcriptional LysR family regulator